MEKCCFWATCSRFLEFTASVATSQGLTMKPQLRKAQNKRPISLKENCFWKSTEGCQQPLSQLTRGVTDLCTSHSHSSPFSITESLSLSNTAYQLFLFWRPSLVHLAEIKLNLEKKEMRSSCYNTVNASSFLQGQQQCVTKPAGDDCLDEAQPKQCGPSNIHWSVLPASFWKCVQSTSYVLHWAVPKPAE